MSQKLKTFERWFRRATLGSLAIWFITCSMWTFVLRPPFGPFFVWWAMVWVILPVLFIFYALDKIMEMIDD